MGIFPGRPPAGVRANLTTLRASLDLAGDPPAAQIGGNP